MTDIAHLRDLSKQTSKYYSIGGLNNISASMELLLAVPHLLDEIEALRKAWTKTELRNTSVEPLRKVKLPDGIHYYNGPCCLGTFLRKADVLAAIKAAGIEVEQ